MELLEYNSIYSVCVCVRERERERECVRKTFVHLPDRPEKNLICTSALRTTWSKQNKVSVFMHLLPFDGEKCRLNKNKISGFKPLHTICWSFDGEKSSKQHEKGLTCTKVLELLCSLTPPASCSMYCHKPQITTAAREVSKLYTRVCAITALVREIQSPAAVPLDTNPQTPAGTSSQDEKGNMQVVQRDKKRTLSSCICVVDTLAKSTK